MELNIFFSLAAILLIAPFSNGCYIHGIHCDVPRRIVLTTNYPLETFNNWQANATSEYHGKVSSLILCAARTLAINGFGLIYLPGMIYKF